MKRTATPTNPIIGGRGGVGLGVLMAESPDSAEYHTCNAESATARSVSSKRFRSIPGDTCAVILVSLW